MGNAVVGADVYPEEYIQAEADDFDNKMHCASTEHQFQSLVAFHSGTVFPFTSNQRPSLERCVRQVWCCFMHKCLNI